MARGRPRGSKNRARDFESNGAEPQPTSPAHSNGGERGRIIREVCEALDNLDAERKAIGSRMRKLQQQRVKGELGMKIADFAAARRLSNLERDDRSTYIDVVRETFAALGVGEQGSFLAAFSPPAPASQRPSTPATRADAMEIARQHLYGEGGDSDPGEDEELNEDPELDEFEEDEDEPRPAA